MTRLRLAAWNVAWFARLFDRRDRLLADDEPSAMPGVSRRRQAEAIASVLGRVDADLVAVIEAPNTGRTQSSVAALEHFAEAYGLRQRAALAGFESPTHQEIALLFDPDRVAAEHAPVGEPLSEAAARAGKARPAAPRFDSANAVAGALCRFSKAPLEARVEDRATGLSFRLIAVHLKSQAPNVGGKPDLRALRIERNRALQRAQATWVRARVEEHLGAGDEIVVLGDFNDGPAGRGERGGEGGGEGGDDEPSSVEIVAGAGARPELTLLNPWLGGELPTAATARFWTESGQRREWAMVDFILLSPGLAPGRSGPDRRPWRVWHPAEEPACQADATLAAALDDASDHFPVSVDLAAGSAG